MSCQNKKKRWVAVCTIVTSLGFLGYFSQKKIRNLIAYEVKIQSRILFEVKVIDETGRPVQGAKVEKDGLKVGTTDSFGEWRRYLQTESGTVLTLKITKQVGNQAWKASKKFSVPEVKKNFFTLDDKNLRNFEIKTSLKAAKIENVSTLRTNLISVK